MFLFLSDLMKSVYQKWEYLPCLQPQKHSKRNHLTLPIFMVSPGNLGKGAIGFGQVRLVSLGLVFDAI